jgi:hypothetical protein
VVVVVVVGVSRRGMSLRLRLRAWLCLRPGLDGRIGLRPGHGSGPGLVGGDGDGACGCDGIRRMVVERVHRRCRRNGRLAVIVAIELAGTLLRDSLVTDLVGCGGDVLHVGNVDLLGRGTDVDASAASVKSDGGVVDDDDGAFIDVAEAVAEVVDLGVVEEEAALPVASFETGAEVAEAVVDASVEADLGRPVAFVPDVGLRVVVPGPVAGSPEQAGLGCCTQTPGTQ